MDEAGRQGGGGTGEGCGGRHFAMLRRDQCLMEQSKLNFAAALCREFNQLAKANALHS